MSDNRWSATFAERLREGDLVRVRRYSPERDVIGRVRDYDMREQADLFTDRVERVCTFVIVPDEGDEEHVCCGPRMAVWVGVNVPSEVEA